MVNIFHFNGRTLEFHSQTEKLESPCILQHDRQLHQR